MFVRLALLWWIAAMLNSRGATFVGEWVPKFKGIDYSVSTNVPGGELGISTRLQVVHALRIDLQDPDVRLFTTPRHPSYVAKSREVAAYTVSDFLVNHQLQAAINANFFSEHSYYLPAGTSMHLYGLAISEGEVVSTQDNGLQAATVMFSTNNQPTVVHTNWPARSTEGVYTAVSGNVALVVRGENVGRVTDVEPRTAFGVSEDGRYLFLVAIDGRQTDEGYSAGATWRETGAWLLRLGAYDGVNMDGGGSTTMVLQDSTGAPVRMNIPSAVADSGRERTVGSHFGVYAKPLPGFFYDVEVAASDTNVSIGFKTLEAVVPTVRFGTTLELGPEVQGHGSASTDHRIDLAGLFRGTKYFYQLRALSSTGEVLSPVMVFNTSNTVVANFTFGLTNIWKFWANGMLPATNWTELSFGDSEWAQGAALLYAGSPAAAVAPKTTSMPMNPSTGFPYVSYYFRTHFRASEGSSGLFVSALIDDGAVFYVNGREVHRVRMPATGITPGTLATTYPCSGAATCRDEFVISAMKLDGLLSSNNVLAVELHNYHARSPSVVFGAELSVLEPVVSFGGLEIARAGAEIVISWTGNGRLQSAAAPDGPWDDVTSELSPVRITPSPTSRFYRLRSL